jgi:hypothetical protein
MFESQEYIICQDESFKNQLIIRQLHVVLKLPMYNNSNGHWAWEIRQFSTFYSVIFLWLIATLATSWNWKKRKAIEEAELLTNKLCLWEDSFITLYS